MPRPDVEKAQQDIIEAYQSQQNDFDKMWFYINQTAHSCLLGDTDMLMNGYVPDPDESDGEHWTAEEYREDHPQDYFSKEERKKIKVPIDQEMYDMTDSVRLAIEGDMKNTLLNPKTLEEDLNLKKRLGMIKGKIMQELGREYKKHLESIPEDDPDREMKARHLTMNDKQSIPQTKLAGFARLQLVTYSALQENAENRRKTSFLKDCEALKKMTMKDFFDKCLMGEKERKAYLRSAASVNLHCTEDTNAYEFFRTRYKNEQKHLKETGQIAKERPLTDDKIASFAYSKYYKDVSQTLGRFGEKLVFNNISEEEKKNAEIVTTAHEDKETRLPRRLNEWEKSALKEVFQDRPDRMYQNYEQLNELVKKKDTVNLLKQEPYTGFYDGPMKGNSEYDKFVNQHIGRNAFFSSAEKQREHLALSMAANITGNEGEKLNKDVILGVSKKIASRNAFKNLTDAEVSEALLSRKNCKDLHKKIVYSTFGVPEENRAAYIREMRELQKSMFSPKGQSAKYNALYQAVKAIADLNPLDPKIGDKLASGNTALLNATQLYTKGKKSVRWNDDSQKRFDNSIDTISVFNKHVPGMRQFAREIVNRTNKVRGEKAGGKYFVDLAQFGVDRAKRETSQKQGEFSHERNRDLGKLMV